MKRRVYMSPFRRFSHSPFQISYSPFLRFSVSENFHSPFQRKGASIKKFTIYWLPVIIYCGAIFIQSSFPATEQIPVSINDKILHFTAYALLGILFYRALGTLAVFKRTHLTALLSIMAASLYGLSDEIHQHFVPSRNADLLDWLADVIGSICGVLIFVYIIRNREARSDTIHGLTK